MRVFSWEGEEWFGTDACGGAGSGYGSDGTIGKSIFQTWSWSGRSAGRGTL